MKMFVPILDFNCILLYLEFIFLFTATFGPGGTYSCEPKNLEVLALHNDGVVPGNHVVLLCRHTYEEKGGSQCNLKWSRPSDLKLTRPLDEYIQQDYFSKDSTLTKSKHVLIIPNITKEDAQVYNCSVESAFNNLEEHYNLTVHDPVPPKIEEKSIKSILHQPVHPILAGMKLYDIDCDASGYPTPTIRWFKNSNPVTDFCLKHLEAKLCLSEDSKTLTIKTVDESSEGKYNCTAQSVSGIDYASTWIITRNNEASEKNSGIINPEILGDSNITLSHPFTYVIDGGTNSNDLKLYLTCYIAGWPIPNVTWFRRDDKRQETELPNSKWPGIHVIDQNELVFENVTASLSDEYGCRDQLGLISPRFRKMKITRKAPKEAETVAGIVMLFFIILTIASAFIIMFTLKSKDSDFMEELIQEFHKGRQVESDSDLETKEKAECLPYNREYEFPRSNLKLGKRLGSGAFGLVMFGEASGIVTKGLVTPVAVKMVKNNYEISQIRALASELKIMQTIGKHLNIVNLLGACTDNLKNLLVITEYCSYGNLHEFLLQNRNIFVGQVDSETGIYLGKDIKSTVLQEMMSVTDVEVNGEGFAKVKKSELENDLEDRSDVPGNNDYDDVPSLTLDSCLENAVDSTLVDSELLSRSKDVPKPAPVSNHYEIDLNVSSKVKFDKTADISKICTDDLFCWAYQIARGMEYLSSRKIVHGDLAIRNVLLANHNIVKISDFGLSKNVYHYADENYVKESKQALPLKWMALESIADRVFSTHSDVWTYGIVLWELFSLAETPYVGMDNFERLFHKLKLGYRMERPVNATADIYNLMLECWNKEPKARPNFPSISRIISDMLEKTLKDYYIGLMEYIQSNPTKIYDDFYQVMCYKKQMNPENPSAVDVEEDTNTEPNTLGLIHNEESIAVSGYLDMHGNP